MSDVEQGDGTRDGGFTEITEENYCEKMQRSCGNSCAGLVLFVISFVLLVWNEGRTVKRAKDIDEGRQVVISIDDLQAFRGANATKVQEQYDEALIYITGDLTTADPLYDPIFGVGAAPATTSSSNTDADNNMTTTDIDSNETITAAPTIAPVPSSSSASSPPPLKLSRRVEMYQWAESSTSRTEKTNAGGTRTITEYSYNKQWSSYNIDSTAFKEQSSTRVNPTQFPFDNEQWTANPILLEDSLVLQSAAVDRLNWFQSVGSVSVDDVPDAELATRLSPYTSNGLFYSSTFHNQSSSNSNPRVGDARITFTQVPADTITIIAGYSASSDSSSSSDRGGGALGNYVTSGGRFFLLLKRGSFTQEEMFSQADDENTTLAWVLRFVGFLLMVIGICLFLQPLANAVDIIPFVGDFLGDGMESCLFPLIACLIAIPLSLFTIALAWLAYRPVWSVPILVVSTCLIVWLCMRTKKIVDHDGGSSGNNYGNNNSGGSGNYGGGNYGGGNYGGGNYGNSGGGGGFANALDDNPSKPNNGDDEEEIAVASAEPFVPQVYKP